MTTSHAADWSARTRKRKKHRDWEAGIKCFQNIFIYFGLKFICKTFSHTLILCGQLGRSSVHMKAVHMGAYFFL